MEFLVFCPAQRVSHKVTFLKLVSEQEKATCVKRTGGFFLLQSEPQSDIMCLATKQGYSLLAMDSGGTPQALPASLRMPGLDPP